MCANRYNASCEQSEEDFDGEEHLKTLDNFDCSHERLSFERKHIPRQPMQEHLPIQNSYARQKGKKNNIPKNNISTETSFDAKKIKNTNTKTVTKKSNAQEHNRSKASNDKQVPLDFDEVPRRRLSITKSKISSSNNSYSNISQEKSLTPKADYKFNNNLIHRCCSLDNSSTPFANMHLVTQSAPKEINYQQNVKSDSFTNLDSSSVITSVDPYLQRRHVETLEKIQKIKKEKMINETKELRDRPKISENSKKIVELLKNPGSSTVYERLTSKTSNRKKQEDIRKIQKMTNTDGKPQINESSQNLQRTIEDLYQWQKRLEIKKEEKSSKAMQYVEQTPSILQESKNILKQRKPDYLKEKVEDRLLQQGKMIKYRIEEAKEKFIESTIAPSTPQSQISRMNPIKQEVVIPFSQEKDRKQVIQHLRKGSFKSESRVIPSRKNSNSIERRTDINPSQLKPDSRKTSQTPEKNQNTNRELTTGKSLNKLMDIRKHLNDYYEYKKNQTNIFIDTPMSKKAIHIEKSNSNQIKDIQEWKEDSSKHWINSISIADKQPDFYEDYRQLGQIQEKMQVKINDRTVHTVIPEKSEQEMKPRYNFKTDFLVSNYSTLGKETSSSKEGNAVALSEHWYNTPTSLAGSKDYSIKSTVCENKRLEDLTNFVNNMDSLVVTKSDIYDRKIVPQRVGITNSSTNSATEKGNVESTNNTNIPERQYSQEKNRNETLRKFQNQTYENEYNNAANNIDYLNERLKLNQLSKNYLYDKLNEFTAVRIRDEKSTGNIVKNINIPSQGLANETIASEENNRSERPKRMIVF